MGHWSSWALVGRAFAVWSMWLLGWSCSPSHLKRLNVGEVVAECCLRFSTLTRDWNMVVAVNRGRALKANNHQSSI